MITSQLNDAQRRTVQRLYRVCRTYREMSVVEPCLEQYEQQIQLLFGEPMTDAAAAWISKIVGELRSGE